MVPDSGGARHAWPGYVDRAEATLDERTRTVDVIVRVPDPFSGGVAVEDGGPGQGSVADDGTVVRRGRRPLLVGEFVNVEIEGLIPNEYFRIRRSALRPGDEVWAVRDGALTIVPVRVFQRSGDEVYVTGALVAGLPIVVGGIEIATEGMLVRTTAGSDR